MDTVKINKSEKLLMIAHRGLSGLETENTNAAFVAAGNRSYFGIETDIHVTSDGKFVVIHDDSTRRVSSFDIDVEKTSFDQLRQITLNDLRAGSDTAPSTRGDLVLPSLAEYVSICKKYSKKCVLELKNPFVEEDIKHLIKEIDALDYSQNMIFISFCLENLVILRKLCPHAKIQYLVGEYNAEVLNALNEHNLDLDIKYTSLTKEITDEVHKNGHLVNCWTCDDATDGQKLSDMGVDFITSNILE